MTDFPATGMATGYLLMVGRAGARDRRTGSGTGSFVLSVTEVPVATAVASIFGPSPLTGTDPTRIPLVAIPAPLAAMAVTGFVSLPARPADEPTAGA